MKKLKLLLALSILCLICVVSEAYFRGYITFYGVKEANKNIAEPESTKLPEATKEAESTKKPENTKQPESTKEPENTKKPTAKKPVKTIKIGTSRNVRVLIMSGDFKSYYHDSIKLTCSSEFKVTTGGKTTSYKAGKKFNISKKNAKSIKKSKITISSKSGQGIKILSFKRRDINPVYRGDMEIKWTKKGFIMVNELPLEKYLYAVVPSEMPTESNIEALKAQAVCARSYAYNQIMEKRYKAYGADLDDSVACQVYNNIPEDKRSRKAVDETYGQVATMDGEIIVTYYFATSWGHTADGKDVWNTSEKVPYLLGSLQTLRKSPAKTGIDLSDEDVFRGFINSGSYKTYDSGDSWYRWNVTLNANNLSERIDSALYNCYISSKALVLTQNKSGKYVQKPLKSIGKVKKLRVEKREKSGLVTELVIVGTNNVVKVCTQYNIRKVLAPVYEKINRKGGTSVSSYSMLPSAAFYIDVKQSKKSTLFKITGGGFGHGAGLSQTGAVAMAESGKSYTEILKHYFNGTKVQDVKKVLN